MKCSIAVVILSVLFATVAQGAILVDGLLPGSAGVRFDSLLDDDSPAAGFPAGNPTAGQNNAGLAFNVTFTPAAGDLNSATAAVNLIEIGGDANGTGLYLLGGEVHFISKMDGAAGNIPGAFDDLNWTSGNNMIGVKSTFGALTAGTEYSVAAVFDPITNKTLDLAVQPTGGTGVIDSRSLINVGGKTNWSGDDSATALQAPGGNGGGNNTVGGNAFSEALVNGNPFEGTAGQGLYWTTGSDEDVSVTSAVSSLNGVVSATGIGGTTAILAEAAAGDDLNNNGTYSSNGTDYYVLEFATSHVLTADYDVEHDGSSGSNINDGSKVNGTILAGTMVNSYVLHSDPTQGSGGTVSYEMTVTFDAPIIGLNGGQTGSGGESHVTSFGEFDDVGVTRFPGGGQGFFDFSGGDLIVNISADQRTLHLTSVVGTDNSNANAFDQLWVITLVTPEPSTFILATLGLLSLGMTRRRRRR